MKKMANAQKSPSDYRYDTSSYVVFDMKVRRESVTGRLIKKEITNNKK